MVVVLSLRHMSTYCSLLEVGLRRRVYLDPSYWEMQDFVHLQSAVPIGEDAKRSRNSWGGKTPLN